MRGAAILSAALLLAACASTAAKEEPGGSRGEEPGTWWREATGRSRGFTAEPGARAAGAMNSFLDALAPEFLRNRGDGAAIFAPPGSHRSQTLRWRVIEIGDDIIGRDSRLEVEVAEDGVWTGDDPEGLLAALRAWMRVNGMFVEEAPCSGIDLTWREPLPERVMEVVREVMAEHGYAKIHWVGELEAGWEDYGRPGGAAEWYAWFNIANRHAVDPLTGEDLPGWAIWSVILHRPGTPFSMEEENEFLLEVLGRCLPEGTTVRDIRFEEEK